MELWVLEEDYRMDPFGSYATTKCSRVAGLGARSLFTIHDIYIYFAFFSPSYVCISFLSFLFIRLIMKAVQSFKLWEILDYLLGSHMFIQIILHLYGI